MDIHEIRNAAANCTNMVQLEELFVGVTAGMQHVPADVRRAYTENVERLGGLYQETGEVGEEMPW